MVIGRKRRKKKSRRSHNAMIKSIRKHAIKGLFSSQKNPKLELENILRLTDTRRNYEHIHFKRMLSE